MSPNGHSAELDRSFHIRSAIGSSLHAYRSVRVEAKPALTRIIVQIGSIFDP